MALMMGALYGALRKANVPDEDATRAAEEVAAYDNRLAGIERRLDSLEAAIESLRVSTKAEFEGLRVGTKAEIEGLRVSLKAEIEGLRREVRILYGLIMVIFAAIVGLYLK